MTKISEEASNKLISLLYSRAAHKVSPKVQRARQILYGEANTGKSSNTSRVQSIDEDHAQTLLGSGLMTLQPQEEALFSVWPKIQSNILKFYCPNSYITREDFIRVYPPPRQQRYEPIVSESLTESKLMFDFQVVKERNAFDLAFGNAYYLIFPTQLAACVYMKETEYKMLNGFHLKFEFAPINTTTLNKIAPELLYSGDEDYAMAIQKCVDMEVKPHVGVQFDNYDVLKELIDYEKRQRTVLVENLPFGLKMSALMRLLWNYRLDYEPLNEVYRNIKMDRSVHLLRFTTRTEALHFVNNFHGKRWDILQFREKETPLNYPLSCEILE